MSEKYAALTVGSFEVADAMRIMPAFGVSVLAVLADFADPGKFLPYLEKQPNPEAIRDFYARISEMAAEICDAEEAKLGEWNDA